MGLRSRFNIISLCAGTGAFDMGIRLAVPHARTVCYVEVEAYACAVLAARIKDRTMDDAPIWSDLTTFDGEPWRGAVDCIIAGLPCTPYSTAGKQRGHDDERAIWPAAIRIIEAVRPAMVFFENVPNFLRFFRPVGEELSRLGYEYQAGIFSAEECGAPQRRERLFILAHSAESIGDSGRERSGRQARSDAGGRGSRSDVANTESDAWHLHARSGRCDEAAPDASGLGLFPPGPADADAWAAIIAERPDLAPAVEREIRRVASGNPDWLGATRPDELRALGNLVVPITAALAFITLAKRLGVEL